MGVQAFDWYGILDAISLCLNANGFIYMTNASWLIKNNMFYFCIALVPFGLAMANCGQ